jgi:hypothetical protein
VEIDPIDERIRKLCTKAASARGAEEVERVLSEMRVALREHAQFVRYRLHTLNHLPKEDSPSLEQPPSQAKAAD